MKHCYERHNFQAPALATIEFAAEIMDEYAADGYDLTLRQLYYQFVARGRLDNTERNYKRLGAIISNARLAGLLDWNQMVDRTREVRELSHWEDPADIIDTCSRQFRIDTRADQKYYVEVWVEKDALAGVVVPACQELDVACLVCRGFVSQSAVWQASGRFLLQERNCVLLYLGDHDPSGIDMTRDIDDRLNMTFGACVDVRRIALTMEQIEEYSPPPNPAKMTDSRYARYVEEYGDECWELDALDPRTLGDIILEAMLPLTDRKKLAALRRKQEKGRKQLGQVARMLKAEPKWKLGD